MHITPDPSPVAPAPTPAPGGGGNDAAAGAASDFETFLTLLTTQLKNQDPLKPLESTQFVAQLASFSAVEQQVRTNDALSEIRGLLGGRSAQGLAAWVGAEVRAEADLLFQGAPRDLFIDPAPGADAARLVVRDSAGRVVQQLNLPASQAVLPWAGVGDGGAPLPGGVYGLTLESLKGGETLASAPVPIYDRVVEARLDGEAVKLVLAGGSVIDASRVSALREPPGAAG